MLEFSKPIIEPLSKAYDAYSFHILPKVGDWWQRWRQLRASLPRRNHYSLHPDQETLKGMMQDAGFRNVDYYSAADGGYRCFASRLQVLTGGTLCLSHPRLPLALKRR